MLTKNDALNEIRDALDIHVNDFDIEGMFEELYQYDDPDGYVAREDVDFWEIADENDTTRGEAADAWVGAGWYSVSYTDGGMPATNDGPVWCYDENDLAGLISLANISMTETHIPCVEFAGSDEEPEEI